MFVQEGRKESGIRTYPDLYSNHQAVGVGKKHPLICLCASVIFSGGYTSTRTNEQQFSPKRLMARREKKTNCNVSPPPRHETLPE